MTASLARKSATVAEYSFPSETKVIIWQNNHNYLRYVSMVTFCTVSPVTIIHAIRYTWAHPHPLIGCPMILPNFTDEGPTHQKLSNVFRVSSLVNDRATCKKAYIPVTDILSLFFFNVFFLTICSTGFNLWNAYVKVSIQSLSLFLPLNSSVPSMSLIIDIQYTTASYQQKGQHWFVWHQMGIVPGR